MIRVGVIGCGHHASENHLQYLSAWRAVRIVAMSDCVFPGEQGGGGPSLVSPSRTQITR